METPAAMSQESQSSSSSLPGLVGHTASMETQATAATWEDNTATCSICGARLGKRHLAPRHHCRLCGRCVCAGCSPNTVQLTSHQGPRRACTECVSNVEKTAAMKSRLASLAERLGCLSGGSGFGGASCEASFEESLVLCEGALAPLERERERAAASRAQLAQLEAEVGLAREACVRFGHRLHDFKRTAPPAALQAAGLGEAVALCEEALGSPEAGFRRLGCVRDAHSQAGGGSVRGVPIPASREAAAPHQADLRVPLRGEREAEDGRAGRSHCCSRSARKCCLSCAILCVCAVALLICTWVAPKVGQSSMDAATITLLSAMLSSPANSSVFLSSRVVLDNAGAVAAHMRSFRALLGARGRVFAWCIFPEIDLVASGPTHVQLDAQLHITDNAGFTAATARILQGSPDAWEISGSPEVTALGLSMRLRVRKKLELPATVLREVRGTNVDILSGSDRELRSTADTSFFSSSVLELRNIGRMVFALHPIDKSGTMKVDVQMGTVTVPNFAVSRGFNMLRNTWIVLRKTPASEPYLSEFLGRWMSGMEQSVMIRGPIESASAFLDNVTTQVVRVAGVAEGLIRSSYVSKFHSLEGHSPGGRPCSLLAGGRCLKGPVVAVQNLLHHAIKLTDISVDVDLLQDLSYDTVLHSLGVIAKHVRCDKGQRLTRLRSAPGMWAYLNASRRAEASVPVPAAPPGGGAALSSCFLAGEAQPGQSDGSACFGQLDLLDCCFTTILPAAACFAAGRDLSIVPSSLRGNLTLVVDGFNISTHFEQTGVPITFANDVPNFRVGPVSMSCRDFTFH